MSTRRTLAILLLLLFVAAPAAGDEDKTATKRRGGDKTKFYDFDELLIGGELRSPNAYFASARQRMRWSRLLRLRKSFLPHLMSSDKYPILRIKFD